MPAHTRTLLSHLHRLAAPAASDAALWSRWTERGDQQAFAALMARHGPMVLGVCRRLIGDVQEAEDVFQAAFLVLARQASRLRQPEALAGFLHTVAVRLARKARRASRRLRLSAKPQAAPEPTDPHPQPLDVLSGRELLTLLDAEIARLPEVYRLPLLLCVLQGRTMEEAARQLGWTIGSLRGRLARGRERLRQRLTQRGLDLSVAAVALLAPAAVPERLLAQAVGNLAVPSPAIAALAVGSTLALKKVAIIGFMLLAATGFALLVVPAAREPDAPATATPSRQAKDETRRDRYGDPLPPGAVARLGSLRFRVPNQIKTLAFAPDGKTLAVSSHAGLFLMDAANGKRIKQLPTLGRMWAPEDHLAFSPDSKRLLCMGPKSGNNGKGVVRLWDLTGDRPPREFEDGQLVTWLGWSADGEPQAIHDERGVVTLHDLASGQSRRFACKEPPKYETGHLSKYLLSAAPAGKALAFVDDKSVIHVWDSANVRERCTAQPSKAYVRAVALSPDGRTLAALTRDRSSLDRETVQIWDAKTGKKLHTVATEQKYLAAIAFAPDGKTLATAGWSDVRFWDVATARERSRSQGEGGGTEQVAFSGDGRTLATVERHSGTIHLWDVATGKRKPEPMGHRCSPYGAKFSPDGRRVATCHSLDGTIHIWDAVTSESLLRIQRTPLWVRDAVFSSDGRLLFSTWTDDNLWISAAANGERRQILNLEDAQRPDTKQSAWSMHLSDDDARLVTLSYYQPKKNDGPRYEETLITGWDPATRKQVFQRRRPGTGSSIAISADARILAAPYPDGESLRRQELEALRGTSAKRPLRLEDLATGEALLTFPAKQGQTSPLAFSPDGRLLASNNWDNKRVPKDGQTKAVVQLWETATAAEVLSLPGADVNHVAFSADGRLLALTAPSGKILIWDLANGRRQRRFQGFDAEVTHLTFSPDGRRLLSNLDDSTLLLWDVGPREAAGKLGAEEAVKAWTDLASADAPRAFRARGTLASSPEKALALLREHLHPAKSVDAQRLRRLLADLESEQFTVREKAQEELEKLGDMAEPALRQTLAAKPTLEVRRRLLALLERLRGPVTQPQMLQSLRAVAVLEDIGTTPARRLLEELAKGAPEARQTREAKASLMRLDRRTPAHR